MPGLSHSAYPFKVPERHTHSDTQTYTHARTHMAIPNVGGLDGIGCSDGGVGGVSERERERERELEVISGFTQLFCLVSLVIPGSEPLSTAFLSLCHVILNTPSIVCPTFRYTHYHNMLHVTFQRKFSIRSSAHILRESVQSQL